MLNESHTLSMGWYPESGFIGMRWAHYCELMMIYLLALGSPTHPITSRSWAAWKRPTINYEGYEYISGNDPLFTHQYSHAWFDFRNQRDAYLNYFQNSTRCGDIVSGEVRPVLENRTEPSFPAQRRDHWSSCIPSALKFCEISVSGTAGRGAITVSWMPLIP
jgi:hypothetical protein